MPKNVLIDSGFWIALFDGDDQYHDNALLYDEYLTVHRLLIPWPSLYEFLNTKFTKRPESIVSFQKKIIKANIAKIPDNDYREDALSKFLTFGKVNPRLSLVDLVIREILSDESVRIDSMVTFNQRDFADLCASRRIEFFNG